MSNLDTQIAEMEDRVLNARTVEAARRFHDKLDALREHRDGRPHRTPIVRTGKHGPAKERSRDYERGYNSGYQAARRKAYDDTHPECDHQGIGYPWCPTCGPRTRALLAEQGISYRPMEPSR